jgi:hypothetical protein
MSGGAGEEGIGEMGLAAERGDRLPCGMIEVRRLAGAEVAPYLDDLARMRIEVFREYPYLYDGSEG